MAFVDRARYMAGTDFTRVPIAKLTSKAYAQTLSHKINLQQALSAEQVAHIMPVLPEHTETTHFSIMDRAGNVVVSTQTINGYFGSGKVVPNTGILLNNEMDDFATKPGALNIFGEVGSAANLVTPQKTPLSSMSPTIVLNQLGQPILALGAPGGTSIITCVTQVLVNRLVFQLPLYDAIATARFHDQWLPDELILEPAINNETKQQLSQLGYKTKTGKVNCYVMAVARDRGRLHSVTDPRGYGMALGK